MSPDDRIFLHNDEKAIIYEFSPDGGDISSVLKIGDPALRGDFEGIAIIDQDFFLLTSNGQIHWIADSLSHHEAIVGSKVLDTGLAEICEAEGLTSLGRKLLIACKKNYRKADKKQLLIYIFDPKTNDTTEYLRVKLSTLGLKKMSASGLAVVNDLIYVTAAKQHLLTIIDTKGDLQKHLHLNKKHHKQTEGIAVRRDGMLVLADEGGKRGRLTIYPAVSDMR